MPCEGDSEGHIWVSDLNWRGGWWVVRQVRGETMQYVKTKEVDLLSLQLPWSTTCFDWLLYSYQCATAHAQTLGLFIASQTFSASPLSAFLGRVSHSGVGHKRLNLFLRASSAVSQLIAYSLCDKQLPRTPRYRIVFFQLHRVSFNYTLSSLA